MKIRAFLPLAFVWPSKKILAFFQPSQPSDVLNIPNHSNLNNFEAILPFKEFLLKIWQTGSVWEVELELALFSAFHLHFRTGWLWQTKSFGCSFFLWFSIFLYTYPKSNEFDICTSAKSCFFFSNVQCCIFCTIYIENGKISLILKRI